jgi:hypothetical protein
LSFAFILFRFIALSVIQFPIVVAGFGGEERLWIG